MKISELQVNDKSVALIVRSLALEVHNFATSRGIPSHSVEDQLPLVFSVVDSHLSDLLDFRDIPAGDTTSLAGISIGFSDEGYRLAARAAKDGVAGVIYCN